MLGNVLGLFPGMGSDAVHGSICVCHLLLRCPIVCLHLFFAAHPVLVLLVSVVSAGENGGDLCAPYCIAARVAAALVIQSSGGVFKLWTLLHDRTGRHCSDHAFFGPFSWSPERGKQPAASTLTLWWLKFGPTETKWEGGGGGSAWISWWGCLSDALDTCKPGAGQIGKGAALASAVVFMES